MVFIDIIKAIVLGIVEGITEWLPISSTGHMILFDEFVKLNVTAEFLEMFLVVIQLGAIMAVIVLYFHKLNPFSPTKTADEKQATLSLWGKVIVGIIPAAIAGILFDDWFNAHFYNPTTVATALIVYGIAFIVIERRNRRLGHNTSFGKHSKSTVAVRAQAGSGVDAAPANTEGLAKINDFSQLDYLTAFKIGLFQVLSIVPGTSRSGSTILGAMLVGTSRTVAAEYSFFLAIPVMFGWSLLKMLKFGLAFTGAELAILAAGVITAFIVSILSIKFLMTYIKKNDFTAFGWYRIVLGALVLLYFLVMG